MSATHYDLNEDSRAEQLRHAESLRKFDIQRRARAISVPTAIKEVQERLRQLGQAITLFGERPADRVERLRESIADLELDEEELTKLQAIMNQSATALTTAAMPMETEESGAVTSSGVPIPAAAAVAGAAGMTQAEALKGQTQKEAFYTNAGALRCASLS
jgi:hypothetical protein